MDSPKFTVGAAVVWHHESRGGYGYVSHIPAKVIAIGAKRIKIEVPLWNSGTKQVLVMPGNLGRPGEECPVPICVMRKVKA